MAVVAHHQERVVADILNTLGFGYYLPQTARWVREKHQRRREIRVLWEHYVPFCIAFPEDAFIVRQLSQVQDTLLVSMQKKFSDTLDTVHAAINAGYQVDPCPGVNVGVKCRVISGPLMGREGEVIRRDGNTLLVIASNMLGASMIEVSPEMVEAVA